MRTNTQRVGAAPAPVDHSPAEPAEPTVEHRPAPARRQRTRKNGSGYRRVMRCLGLLFVVGIMLALWFLGAMFTVRFVHAVNIFGFSLAVLATWAYLIPLGITVTEFAFAPWRESDGRWQAFWGAVFLFDALTTALGFSILSAAQPVEPFALTIPLLGVVGPIGAVIGVVLALTPEPVMRWAVAELWEEITG